MLQKSHLTNPTIRKIFGEVELNTILKKLYGKTLKQTERNYLYRSIRPKLIAAELLAELRILKEINKNNKETSKITEYNLAIYGYELLQTKKSEYKKIPLEDLIILILTKHSKARYIEGIPILLIKNPINKFKLLELGVKAGVKNKLGYLLETAFIIKPIPKLKDLLTYLQQNRDKDISFLVDGDKEFLIKTSPERVKKWNLLGRFFDEDFRKNAEAYL